VQSALGALASAHDEQNRLLFAAVSEAMKHGTKRQGAQLLHRILDKYNNTASPAFDTPSLLRCTARLLLSAILEEETKSVELLSRLCAIFKLVVALSQAASADNMSRLTLSLDDCKWFEMTGYKEALDNINKWPVKYLIDLLFYSSQVSPKTRILHSLNVGRYNTPKMVRQLVELRKLSMRSTHHASKQYFILLRQEDPLRQ